MEIDKLCKYNIELLELIQFWIYCNLIIALTCDWSVLLE